MTDLPGTRFNYVELSVSETTRSRAFYEEAFGWAFADYGPSYSATATGDTDLGLDASTKTPPLPVIESRNLAVTRTAVLAAGGRLTRDIYGFPGGSRFEFTDPDGNRLAVWQQD